MLWLEKLDFIENMKKWDIYDALDVKLLELEKVHTNDNGVDMMTRELSRKKFEICCEMICLVVITT